MADVHDVVDAAEEDVAVTVAEVLDEVADEFAQALADATEIVAARFSVSRIAGMFTARMPRIVRRLLGVAEQAAEQAADDVGGNLPEGWDDLPTRYDDDTLPPAMSEYVDVTEHLLRAVGERLAEAARDELAAGVDAGDDMEALRVRLRERFAREGSQLGDMREERVARTESGRAWNTATLGAAQAVEGPDRPIVKQWVTRRDDRVRDDHQDANGQIQFLNDPFTVGSVQMSAPHDPTAPAGQVVNCRCVLAVFPEVRSSAAAPIRLGLPTFLADLDDATLQRVFEWGRPGRTPPPAVESQVRPSAALTEARETSMAGPTSTFHGTQGRPSYRKYHPKGTGGGKTRHSNGGWLGSDRFTEDEHQTALREYTSNAYTNMNNALRHGTYPGGPNGLPAEKIRRRTSVLNDLINVQDPTTSETTLYRRMENHQLQMNEGDEFHDRGFVSTTTTEGGGAIELGPRDPNYTYFKITVPKGAQMLDVLDVGRDTHEKEVILPPGTKFRVKKVVSQGDPRTPASYELEAINAVVAALAAALDALLETVTAAVAEEEEGEGDFQERVNWQAGDIVIDKRASAMTAAAAQHTGAMIALLPAEEDAERLALDGGEEAGELHLTLFFLGEGADWDEDQRQELIANVRAGAAARSTLTANVFGANHWNPDSDTPSWVWAVGDDREAPADATTLHEMRMTAVDALEDMHSQPELPVQHSPWSPHVCAAYSDDPGLLPELTERVGPITFDRIRVAFAGEHTDISLGPAKEDEEPMPDTTAAAADAPVEADEPPPPIRRWSTPDDTALAFEDMETGDGRLFTSKALYWDGPGPWPLQYADEMLMGHEGAELAGAIEKISRDGRRIPGNGVLYLNRPAGLDAVTLLEQEAPLGVSVDLDDVDIEFVDRTLDPEDDDWLFASARLASASVMRMADGSVMLSAATAPAWTASGSSFSRFRYDLQLITDASGTLTAAAIRDAFAGTGTLTAAAGDADDPEAGIVIHSQKSGDFLVRITRARLRGATLVAMPAYAGARIVLDPVDQEASAAPPAIVAAAGDTRERVVTYVRTSPAAVGPRDVSKALGIAMTTARKHLNHAVTDGLLVRLAPGLYAGPTTMPEGAETTASADDDASAAMEELEASAWEAMKALPPMPAAWFREPTEEDLPPGSGGVHYSNGRIFGWVAQAGEPHAGFPGKKLTIESLGKIDMTHFLRARFDLDDGSQVKAGAFTMNAPHHRDGAECESAACQFDDSRTVAGIVTCGMNERGMWFSGAAAPWLSEWDRTVFQGCQPSYHMKKGRKGWELRAVLSVPVPGHSSPLVATAVTERSNLALAASAAGLLTAPDTVSGQAQDSPDGLSGPAADTAFDLPGQRPDVVSGQVPSIDVEALAAALLDGPFIDHLAAAMNSREAARRAEIEALAASMAVTPEEITASAAPKGAS